MNLKPSAYFRFVGIVAVVLLMLGSTLSPSLAAKNSLTSQQNIAAIETQSTLNFADETDTTSNLTPETPEQLANRGRRFNLTGRWESDDGGIYYLRQVDHELWWYGQKSDRDRRFDDRYDDRRDRRDRDDDRRRLSRRFLWSNVFHGYIGNREITGSWVDVPRGEDQNSGAMVLEIVSSNRLRAVSKTGRYGSSEWNRF